MRILKTSFAVTESALKFENVLLSHMDISRSLFHRRMIDYFFENHIKIHPYLLITDKTNPNYIRKKAVEQIYIDEIRKGKIEEVADEYGCRTGVVLFQAMMSYSLEIAPEVLGPEELGRLFMKEG